MSWSPFVGMFIARISKVVQFANSSWRLFIPTSVIIVRMAIFGGIAIDQVANKVGEIGVNGLQDNITRLCFTLTMRFR